MERRLQQTWAEVLHIAPQSIGRDDSFLKIGGDSIAAIRLIAAARNRGIEILIGDIFSDPRLLAIATKARHIDVFSKRTSLVKPFELLSEDERKAILTDEMKTRLNLSDQMEIEDAYPCSSLQEGLLALAVKQPGSYVTSFQYRLSERVNIDKFQDAWEKTVQVCGILRTRIVQLADSSIQMLITGNNWDDTRDMTLASYLQSTQAIVVDYGSPLCRYALIQENKDETYFILTMHHTIFDGWSMQIFFDTLHRAFDGQEIEPLAPYSRFIQYTMNLDYESASKYWTEQLCKAEKASFPPTSTGITKRSENSRSVRTFVTDIELPDISASGITRATILRATWSLLLARYCDTDDVCFGTTISGRQAPLPGIMDMAGPAIATVPVRTRLDRQESVLSFLQSVQEQALAMVEFEQFGLQKIRKLSSDAFDACDFSSLLVIQPKEALESACSRQGEDPILISTDEALETGEYAHQNYFNYPLVVQGHLNDESAQLVLIYDSEILHEKRIVALSHQFQHVAKELALGTQLNLGAITVASSWDLQQSGIFNSEVPQVIESCFHALVEMQVVRTPDATAICAWDGAFTYAELDQAANRLAHHLMARHTVKLDEIIHVCFDKSLWFFVSILAINKAGAAWAPLDPSHPPERLRQIIRQTNAVVALTSESHSALCSSLMPLIIQVTPSLDQELSHDGSNGQNSPNSGVSPANAAYCLYTSGSTGVPKCLVMEHRGVCSSQMAIIKRLKLHSGVRMLQFAAFVFDLSIGEIVAPLISGACICVPSEEARLNDIAGFIRETNVNWAYLTPSFVRILKPEEVPGLELLLLCGEVTPRDVFNTWIGKVRFISGWGPAETCVFSSLHEWKSSTESPLTVGKPVGAFCWIVDPNCHDQVAPIGTVGEVMLQGPTLLREYLNDAERTNSSVITSLPQWALQKAPQWKRFYKSGDLAMYNHDGTIEFCSRRDTQVKIRGLRVELSEVEYRIREELEGVCQVAADMLATDRGSTLVSYICFNDETRSLPATSYGSIDKLFTPPTAEIQALLTAMVGKLKTLLPNYMIPSVFLICKYMPSITSTKLDRKTLRKMTSLLSHDQLSSFSTLDNKKRAPETEMERRFQSIWASLLNIPSDSIGRDDHFLQIGGDSILSIRLVSRARAESIEICVKDVFDDSRLLAVASKATLRDGKSRIEEPILPFMLMPQTIRDTVQQTTAELCHVPVSAVEDAFPCTSLQEGLMALSVKQRGSYVAKYVYRLSSDVDVAQFREAWNKTVELCGALRTRIVLVDNLSIQVLVKHAARWEDTSKETLSSFVHSDRDLGMSYGTPLCWYALLREAETNYFIWSAHHVIYDGWTMQILLKTLETVYRQAEVPHLQPYNAFVQYCLSLDHDAAANFWRTELHGSKRAAFPSLNDLSHRKSTQSTRVHRRTIALTNMRKSSVTKASTLRAAWAIVLSRYCDADDFTFGATVSGRQAPVPGLEAMAGLTIATVPIRIRLDKKMKASDFLVSVQNQSTAMIPFEQMGIQNIAYVSPDAKDACSFSSLLVIQPQEFFMKDSTDAILLSGETERSLIEDSLQTYFNYPLVLIGAITDNSIELRFFSTTIHWKSKKL